MKRVVIALADRDFDPTEVVAPWRAFCTAGFEVVFATGTGKAAACDPLLLSGVIFGQLGAKAHNVVAYAEMVGTSAFQHPVSYADISVAEFGALVLPGGHAKGMRQYLESTELQMKVVAFFEARRPVGAICHGSVVLARSIDPNTGKSVLHGRRCTALTKSLESTAWALTAWKLGDYYRTYPEWVQDEVSRALSDPSHFETGPMIATYNNGFIVRDGNLVTARWPGDAERFAAELVGMLRAADT